MQRPNKYYGLIICFLILTRFSQAQNFSALQPVQLATNLQFTEGPAWHADGYLVFSDVSGNTIYKWSEAGGLGIFKAEVGNSNGIIATKWNDFIVCRHGERDVVEMDTLGNINPIATHYNGKRLNSPNDVTMSYRGSIYFTDPDYGVQQADRELTFQGLYCLPYNSNELVLLDSTLVKPNGLTFNQDWRTLYVCESETNTIYSYFLRDEFNIQDMARDKQVFAQLPGTGGIDGITADVEGNVYVAFGDGGIVVLNPEGQTIGNITFPPKENVRNLCFGGKYLNQLFVTAGNSLYKMDIRYHGDFIGTGILGIPTDKSVVFNAVSDQAVSAFIEFGESENNLSSNTEIFAFSAEVPIEIKIDELQANARYYYQLKYKAEGQAEWEMGQKGTFHTARPKNSTFAFALEADPHLDEGSNYTTFRKSLLNTVPYQPDFLIDLGDNFLTEKFPIVNAYYMEQRNLLYRHFWDDVCHSMPLFIVNGNHEGELGWFSQNKPDDVFNSSTRIRKMYYPNPQPDGFYSGSEKEELFVGKRENYYAWNWGDALFVVIDPFSYITERGKDPWRFTLGKTQYDWFRKTLEESDAKYKFVFGHHILGGDEDGRGGIESVDYFEMGGKNIDGSYGFDDKRPGWGKPIHQIMVDEGVQVYFHGHDHFYAEQEKDGIIYQLVPQPSFPSYTKVNEAENYGYLNGIILPNAGNLIVTVNPDSAKVEYIGAYHVDNKGKGLENGQVRRTYYISPNKIKTSVSNNVDEEVSISMTMIKNGVQISSVKEQHVEVKLYNMNGQDSGMLYQGAVNLLPINLSITNYPAGIYIVKLESSEKVLSLKTIRQ